MKTLLSVNITESQKVEFPTWDQSVGSFPTVSDFTPISLHRRKIRRPHVRSVYLFHQLVGLLGFDCLLNLRVGQHCVPVLSCFLPAGMSHEVDECVVPIGCPLRYPVTDDLQIVFG